MDKRDLLANHERMRDAAPFEVAPVPPAEQEYLKGIHRELLEVPPPPAASRWRPSLENARGAIREAMLRYLALEDPEHMLLIKAIPGIGTTTAAVAVAEMMAEEGRRVLYACPRHDMFPTLISKADRPDIWYEWQPRQLGNEAEHKPETCPHANEMMIWLGRGYKGMDFCRSVCGWGVVNGGCAYHAQKRQGEPIIFGQHQHVILGHPLEFDVVVGDEYPVPAFCHPWHIPARWVAPDGMDPTDDATAMIHELARLCDGDRRMDGPELLQCLGGAPYVRDVCAGWVVPAVDQVLAPTIHAASEVDQVPYAHLPLLAPLLRRESEAAAEGRKYPPRVLVREGHLTLLLRRAVNEQLPPHVVWLDATGNERLYRTVFQRPVEVMDAQPRLQGRIIQVHDRANGKSSLMDTDGALTAKAAQTEAQVARILDQHAYKDPAVISYEKVLSQSTALGAHRSAHYYADRGTNDLEDVDAIFVIGTPQPPLESIETMAKMVFFERMKPFEGTWYTKPVPYNYVGPDGRGRAYPTSGYWADPDLQALLWSLREAEIIQAAHRARPVNHPVDIWLLTNVPIAELPLDGLVSIAEVMGAPDGVDPFRWPEVMRVAGEAVAQRGYVTTRDFVEALLVKRRVAVHYLRRLIAEFGWVSEQAARPPERTRGGSLPLAAKPP